MPEGDSRDSHHESKQALASLKYGDAAQTKTLDQDIFLFIQWASETKAYSTCCLFIVKKR